MHTGRDDLRERQSEERARWHYRHEPYSFPAAGHILPLFTGDSVIFFPPRFFPLPHALAAAMSYDDDDDDDAPRQGQRKTVAGIASEDCREGAGQRRTAG